MLCIKSLLTHLCGRKDGLPSGDPHTQAAKSSLQKIPVEEIFGSPREPTKYTEHFRYKDATSTPGVTSVVSKGLPETCPFPLSYCSKDVMPRCRLGELADHRTEMESPCAVAFPTLQFAVLHDVRHSVLHVFLLKAANLPSPAASHKLRRTEGEGVFVTAHIYPTKKKIFESKVVSMSQNPVFKESWEFSNHMTLESLRGKSLVFLIYRGTETSRAFLGSVVLPLGDADLYGTHTTMKINKTGENLPFDLNGDVLLSCTYNPMSRLLQGTVSRITNLHRHLADPYVKINLMHRGVRQAKWKTSVKSNTLTPVFNESFQFDISGLNTCDLTLEVVVCNYKHRQFIGEVFIGEQVSSESGRSHWADMISSPLVVISHWHSIQ